MLILAQPQKIIGADFPGQSEPFRAHAKPFASHALAFIVVIADAEVFLEVFPRVCQVVLRLCRDHAPDITRTVRAFCVADTSSHPRFLVNCLHEHDRDSEAGQATVGHLPHRPGICPRVG
jgi:hypothetical protein